MFCKPKRKIDEAGKISKDIDRYLEDEQKKMKKIHQLLLLGTGESGKTTILKQMKIIHINGYSDTERAEKIPFIKHNIRESIHDIVYHMDKIDPPVAFENEKTKASAEYILNIGLKDEIEYNDDFFDHVSTLWADPGVKKTFDRSNEYQLIDCAAHFLERMEEIRKQDYMPTTQDILFCRIKTVTISKIEFSVPVPKKYGGGTANFWLTDVGGQRGERKKWISLFDGIEAVLFLIACSDFDQRLREDNETNRLKEAFELFEDMFWSKFLRKSGMIVFLNKQDLLKKKIESGKKLSDFFPEFQNYKPKKETPADDYERAKFFMRDKLLEVPKNKPPPEWNGIIDIPFIQEVADKDVYIHFTTATDTNNIKLVFESVRDIILTSLLKGGLI